MRTVVAAAGIAALAGSVVLAGCSSSSSSSASASASPSASQAPLTSQSAEPAATGTCALAPDTKVTDITYAQLQQYALNNGESIPTLAQFLDLANEKKVGVLPEIKTFPAAAGQPNPEPTQAQYQMYQKMMDERTNITQKLIGSFDEFTLKYFAQNEPTWPRIWFRSLGGKDPVTPPTVAEMKERAPDANALGVINVMYIQGDYKGVSYNVPQEFASASIPVYIWYNTATKGDTAVDGAPLSDLQSPGWQTIASLQPKNVKWIATDMIPEYTAWANSAPDSAKPIPEMVAHRGGGEAGVSENSLAAFTKAAAEGAQVLETDVQWTKATPENPNGVPVLMHDATINRTVKCKA